MMKEDERGADEVELKFLLWLKQQCKITPEEESRIHILEQLVK